jgi:hypothetical protein
VVNNEALDPIDVRLLGTNAVMLSPNDVAYLVEQFWFVRESAARYYWGHGNDFRFPRVKLKPD